MKPEITCRQVKWQVQPIFCCRPLTQPPRPLNIHVDMITEYKSLIFEYHDQNCNVGEFLPSQN